MKFDVYCDESRPDLLSSSKTSAQYMVIGSLWLRTEARDQIKAEVHALRNKHKIGGEFKWQKVSPSRQGYYSDLVKLFFDRGDDLRFRCIAVDHKDVDLKLYHNEDQELGFYKFYYQVLHHWIHDCNEYSIFLDYKQNRVRSRLAKLKECLSFANLSSNIKCVQSVKSDESVLIQLSDLLTGMASARLNNALSENGSKEQLCKYAEELLGKKIAKTSRDARKFNVFIIDLKGGW